MNYQPEVVTNKRELAVESTKTMVHAMQRLGPLPYAASAKAEIVLSLLSFCVTSNLFSPNLNLASETLEQMWRARLPPSIL